MKTYRAIYQWNAWLSQSLGKKLVNAERDFFSATLVHYPIKKTLLLGVPAQQVFLSSVGFNYATLLGPLINRDKTQHYIEGEFNTLPIQSASVDMVLLPHTLECIDNPRLLFSEACRVIRPEGHIIILGFNLYSLWGLKKLLKREKHIPWTNHFISMGTIKEWLSLADFELIKQENLLFRPPMQRDKMYDYLKCLEWIGKKFHTPWGSVYALIAKAKVIPLTPIRLHWKQTVADMGAIPTMSSRVNTT